MTALYQAVAVRAVPASGVAVIARSSGLVGYLTVQWTAPLFVSGVTAAPLVMSTLVAELKVMMLKLPLLPPAFAPEMKIDLPSSVSAMPARPVRVDWPATALATIEAVRPDL